MTLSDIVLLVVSLGFLTIWYRRQLWIRFFQPTNPSFILSNANVDKGWVWLFVQVPLYLMKAVAWILAISVFSLELQQSAQIVNGVALALTTLAGLSFTFAQAVNLANLELKAGFQKQSVVNGAVEGGIAFFQGTIFLIIAIALRFFSQTVLPDGFSSTSIFPYQIWTSTYHLFAALCGFFVNIMFLNALYAAIGGFEVLYLMFYYMFPTKRMTD